MTRPASKRFLAALAKSRRAPVVEVSVNGMPAPGLRVGRIEVEADPSLAPGVIVIRSGGKDTAFTLDGRPVIDADATPKNTRALPPRKP